MTDGGLGIIIVLVWLVVYMVGLNLIHKDKAEKKPIKRLIFFHYLLAVERLFVVLYPLCWLPLVPGPHSVLFLEHSLK